MGPLQTRTDSRGEGSYYDFAEPGEATEMTGRHEPQTLMERIVPKDPYAAWLEQREAEREREHEGRPRVRWVQRQRGADGRAIVAGRL